MKAVGTLQGGSESTAWFERVTMRKRFFHPQILLYIFCLCSGLNRWWSLFLPELQLVFHGSDKKQKIWRLSAPCFCFCTLSRFFLLSRLQHSPNTTSTCSPLRWAVLTHFCPFSPPIRIHQLSDLHLWLLSSSSSFVPLMQDFSTSPQSSSVQLNVWLKTVLHMLGFVFVTRWSVCSLNLLDRISLL